MRRMRTIPGLAIGIAILCVCLIIAGQIISHGNQPSQENRIGAQFTIGDVAAALEERNGYFIRTAVIYSSEGGRATPPAAADYLSQSTLVNLTAAEIDTDRTDWDPADYDVLFPDESLLSSPDWDQIRSSLISFTQEGGSVLLPNAFCQALPMDYLGITAMEKLTAFPESLEYPAVPEDETGLQDLISDFCGLYRDFPDAAELMTRDYGFAFQPGSAIPLCTADGKALYTLNHYGGGMVLLCSPLLPNQFLLSSFSMDAREGQLPFSPSTAGCNQLFLNEFVTLHAKLRYGMAIRRVFGCYGSPSMSWQLHYEEISAIEHASLITFSQYCETLQQIPSYSLVRTPYFWLSQSETAAYALNTGGSGELQFSVNRYESSYSSGTHIDSGGVWLQGSAYSPAGSYFDAHPEENYRFFPCALDYNKDGFPDLFCGGQDGTIRYYCGEGFSGLDGRIRVGPPQLLEGVSTGSFAAPQLLDLDGDGLLDLIAGGGDGSISWFRGAGSLTFLPQGTLMRPFPSGQCLPAAGDVDGDGVPDLLIGSDRGELVLYRGSRQDCGLSFAVEDPTDLSHLGTENHLGHWLSPSLCDYDGDGSSDLVLGTFEGFVALFRGDGSGDFRFLEYFTAEDDNVQGNHNLKFGTYCTPLLLDLDGNGSLDLLCGYEEYGLAYPIDSPYFPFRSQLQEQIDYIHSHRYYLGIHFLTGAYYSADREAEELALHREAMASYGADAKRMGANHHTWFSSVFSPAQSLLSIADAGLLWESGFSPAGATLRVPQNSPENVISLPFFLVRNGEPRLLVQNVSVLGYAGENWTDLSAKYGMPMCAYYHCDWIYRGGLQAQDAGRTAELLAQFQEKNGYNFVREDQMMAASAAAYNLTLVVSADRDSLSIHPKEVSSRGVLYDRDMQKACGVRLDFASGLRELAGTDAPVWKRAGSDLTVGLDGTVRVFGQPPAGTDPLHLEQVNLPATFRLSEDSAELTFLSDGMMQAVVSGPASTQDEGWSVVSWGNKTKFTKFGAADTLHILYQEAH